MSSCPPLSLARRVNPIRKVPGQHSFPAFHWKTLELTGEDNSSPFSETKLAGSDLETIERAGCDPEHGTPFADLPTPLPGDARKQELRITLPAGPPSPDAALYVWLRGESEGRARHP